MAEHIPITAGEVQERYRKGLDQIRDEVRNYWLNHAFWLGYQWLFWNEVDGTVDTSATPDQPDRIQATMNRMRANGRNLIAQLTQRELSFEVKPSMYDDATVRSAQLAQSLLRDHARTNDWETIREQLAGAALKGGTAALSVDWDDETQQSYESVLTISEFVVEPGARDAERARWWVRSQLLPPEEVQALYSLSDVPEADGQRAMDAYHISNLNHTQSTRNGQTRLTNVLTYYERPNALCPDGRWAIVVNNQIVQHGIWSFPFKDYLNLAIVRETIVENQWAGRSILDDVRPVQVMLNGTWSMVMEHVKNASTNRQFVPESAADFIYAAEDVPGEMHLWPDGVDLPKYADVPQIPMWARDQLTELAEVIDDLMGVHDVSRGQAPPNIESGYGLSILAEKDSSPVGKLIKDISRAFSKIGSMVLMLHGELVTEKRDMYVHTSRGSYHAPWKGSDLSGQYTAEVPLEAVLPRSRSAQMQFAKDALQMGLIQSLPEFSRLAELPQGEDLVASVAPDIDKARRENEYMAHGEVALPAVFDDHEVHILEHNNFRKSERYHLMSADEKAVIDNHVDAHETMAAEEASKMSARADLDPRLGMVPSADGAPPMPPIDEVVPPPAQMELPLPPPQEDGELNAAEIVDPDSVVADILNQLGL